MGSVVAKDIELGFVWKFIWWYFSVLVTFDMFKDDGDWYPVDVLINFIDKVVVIG